uniref:Uncharacterized protein n=1 Tax=Arundo donax TaxID=35708 RepID=A0A0A8XUD3_ARUDO
MPMPMPPLLGERRERIGIWMNTG